MKFHEFMHALQPLLQPTGRSWFSVPELPAELRQRVPNSELSRWTRSGRLLRLRRELYAISPAHGGRPLDPLEVANPLYQPSYISMTTALAYHGILDWSRVHDPHGWLKQVEPPDLVVSVTTRNTQRFRNTLGSYRYHHLNPELYWGYQSQPLGTSWHPVADPHKALFDLWYFHPIRWTPKLYDILQLATDTLNPLTLRSMCWTPHVPRRLYSAWLFWDQYWCAQQGIAWQPHRTPHWFRVESESSPDR
ncbi:type IV toxin-antitoxin system AbiEi family antitoxin domain-containing protein [Spirochaeta africana]|uniref:Transcriptional regulator AbiEi antitoxin N-terminal domain-containing protein n=1 Tax=Spirochaeta africana (strain ATCC 700263 / DSM 8902 / Z-7692) TaxID=889378 RepID=H9UF93_SPIAZ|nr:hypothetical protein [Spirochaeta africana]AFG36186.1 hypothetical protein Spiaf_0077 [Spirochaeta africana DSM 8902]